MIILHPSVLYLTSQVVNNSLFPLKHRISQILPVILRSSHSALLLAPSTPIMVIFEFCSMRRFQWLQKLLYGSKKISFYCTWKFPLFFQNWTTIKLAFTPLFKNLLKFTILRCSEVCKRSIWSSQWTNLSSD